MVCLSVVDWFKAADCGSGAATGETNTQIQKVAEGTRGLAGRVRCVYDGVPLQPIL